MRAPVPRRPGNNAGLRTRSSGKGIHHGEGLYESGGFVVHFFSAETVERLADDYQIVEIERFNEGALPRDLSRVTLRKAAM